MKNKKLFIVDHGTYPFDIIVDIGNSDEVLYEFLQKHNKIVDEELKELLQNKGNGRAVMLSGGQTVLRIRNKLKKPDFYSTLAHEVFHCVEFLFDRIGIQYDMEKTGEAFAYQIGYIIENILKECYNKDVTKLN